MIKEEDISICVAYKNFNYYKNLNYDCVVGDTIMVKIEDIPKNSHIKVTAICEKCGTEKILSYQKYNKNIKIHNFYTCRKCSYIKNKLTNNIRYGVDHPIQNSDIYNKLKQTNIEKYGVENVFQNEKIKNKIKTTNIINFGVEYPQQNKKILQKSIVTNNNKYGCDRPAQNKTIYDKIKITKKLKYGDEYFNNQIKTKNTIFRKYGIENISQLTEHINSIHNHFTNKMLLKYNIIKKIDYIKHEYVCVCEKEHEYKITSKLFHNRLSHNINTCTICCPENSISSDKENQLLNYIKNIYSGTIIKNDRKILNGKELDIYCPDLNLAIEYNGLYWHSNIYKDDNYHLNKMLLCLDKNIQLIHIWEDDWIYNNDKIKTKLYNIINNTITEELEVETFYVTDNILLSYNIADIIPPIKWNIVGNKRIKYNITNDLPYISDCGKIILMKK